jgi:formylglycine-generating enzyme required for sulfatase activity
MGMLSSREPRVGAGAATRSYNGAARSATNWKVGAWAAFVLACAAPALSWAQDAAPTVRVSDLGVDLPRQIALQPDQMPMAIVPAGSFLMGSNDPASSGGDPDEAPAREVYLPTYYIDMFEVSNSHYALFLKATGYTEPPFMRTAAYGAPNQPVVGVTWDDAAAYAKWAGKRLPTEAEWEKAARGTDGRLYPWGNALVGGEANNRLAKLKKPSGAGEFAGDRSPYGVMDMAGNISEWTADWYGQDFYRDAPGKSPTGPATGDRRTVRGGGWDYDADKSRSISRNAEFPSERRAIFGFRCVYTPGSQRGGPQSDAPEVLSFDDAPRNIGGTVDPSLPIEQVWEQFEGQFRLFFESHRPLLEHMTGDIGQLYPAADRRDAYIVNLSDRHVSVSLVNESRKAIVYDETIRVNSAFRARLPVGPEKLRLYVIENDGSPEMEKLGEVVVAPGSKPLSILLDIRGKHDPGRSRVELLEKKIDEPAREFALINQTAREIVFTLTDMEDLRVYREHVVPAGGYVLDNPTSGTYRVVAKYRDRPGVFAVTDVFAFLPETIRQSAIASPSIGASGDYPRIELNRSVYVPD